MKGLYATLLEDGWLEARGPRRILHWLEAEAERADEAAWAEAWKRTHPARVKADLDQVVPLVAWTPWPEELALEWLGLEPPPAPPALPENVRILLEKARPLLVRRR
ncbi:hypothetical protein [Streptomyces sp. NPDC001068]|uniref:hypothetical protein n=1 Tax=Streptomyces sp. NPDC001068 TaxID=3364544 RepID=UPI0036903862